MLENKQNTVQKTNDVQENRQDTAQETQEAAYFIRPEGYLFLLFFVLVTVVLPLGIKSSVKAHRGEPPKTEVIIELE